MPSSAAARATRSAIMRACDSDSMTHGPAMRKSGLPPPRRRDPIAISRVRAIEWLLIAYTFSRALDRLGAKHRPAPNTISSKVGLVDHKPIHALLETAKSRRRIP